MRRFKGDVEHSFYYTSVDASWHFWPLIKNKKTLKKIPQEAVAVKIQNATVSEKTPEDWKLPRIPAGNCQPYVRSFEAQLYTNTSYSSTETKLP